MCIEKFKEWVIFEKEKNTPNKNSADFKNRIQKKYNYKGNMSSLYQKVIKYQIEVFGKTLCHVIEMHNSEECYKLAEARCKQRYSRRKGRKNK